MLKIMLTYCTFRGENVLLVLDNIVGQDSIDLHSYKSIINCDCYLFSDIKEKY